MCRNQLLKLLLFSRCHKKENDLSNALLQWRNIESAFISKEAEYSKLLSEKRNLSDAFADLQNQLENVRTRAHAAAVTRGVHSGFTLALRRWRVFCQTQRTS